MLTSGYCKAIAADGTYRGQRGASTERGDNDAISRYIDNQRMEKLLKPFIEKIQGEAKKPSPQPYWGMLTEVLCMETNHQVSTEDNLP
ncbi:hypothetical protein [Nodosilinea sp. FACHB-13]|uniref:hypothetical protein n=1 Tax=Cyanophyceae TaxID=3028117 RepID=UPI00168A0D8C|nr:hypothetical protein [Nodosilinea sp. FACHB-13]MBD2109255.1 hypothetical protein [Nodosilinea sp. FACHB-13]